MVVVRYFAPNNDVSNEAFISVSEALYEDYLFGVTNYDALRKAEQTNVNDIFLYKNFDEVKSSFEQAHDGPGCRGFCKGFG